MEVEVKSVVVHPLPDNSEKQYYGWKFKKDVIQSQIIDKLDKYTGKIEGATIYLQDKVVSQDKLREAGFKITRSTDKADFILIGNLFNYTNSSWRNHDNNVCYDSLFPYEDIIRYMNLGYKFLNISHLYQYLYKYIGDKTLYTTLDELFKSNSIDNVKMAMEMMTNADWRNNELYLVELFNNYYTTYNRNNMRQNSYHSSISFQGFLEGLKDINPNIHFSDAGEYSEYCKTDEHHQFVYDKYKEQFNEELRNIFERYKMHLKSIDYEIDKSYFKK